MDYATCCWLCARWPREGPSWPRDGGDLAAHLVGLLPSGSDAVAPLHARRPGDAERASARARL